MEDKCKACIHYFFCKYRKTQYSCSEFMHYKNTVEVVRCKYCKHLSDDGYCQQNLYGIAPYKIPKDEDFCSYGEKKMVNLEDVVDIEAQTKANNEAMRKVIGFMTGKETK